MLTPLRSYQNTGKRYFQAMSRGQRNKSTVFSRWLFRAVDKERSSADKKSGVDAFNAGYREAKLRIKP